jgi:hypothetical protein
MLKRPTFQRGLIWLLAAAVLIAGAVLDAPLLILGGFVLLACGVAHMALEPQLPSPN